MKDKTFLLVFVITSLFILNEGINTENVVMCLVIFIFTSIIRIVAKTSYQTICVVFLLMAIFFSIKLIVCLPLLMYCANNKYDKSLILLMSIFMGLKYNVYIILFTGIMYVIYEYEQSIIELKASNQSMRDEIKSQSLVHEKAETNLLSEQEFLIESSILKERNRIARDIHDNVGHLLSGSILLIGALDLETTDSKVSEDLKAVKGSLDKAMSTIRDSVHNLYDNSLNLKEEINSIITSDNSLNIKLSYSISSEPSVHIHASFLFIIKESINNCRKHSNANRLEIIVNEYKDRYLLIVEDNGSNIKNIEKGLGLISIEKRVEQLDGILNISHDEEFRLYVNVGKGLV